MRSLNAVLLSLSLLSISASLATAAEPPAKEPVKHSFFVAGPSFTGIIDEAGAEEWDSGRPAARDGYVLANGNILIAWGDEVKEFTREKRVVFEFKKSPANQE